MQVGAQPWYQLFLAYVINIVPIIYQIGMLVILGLALKHFKRLVDHYAPKESLGGAVEGPLKVETKEEREF